MEPVPRLWPGSTIVCCASGPSLTQEDVSACQDQRVIVINDTYKLAPWADALFAADFRWWERNPEALRFEGLKFGADRRVGKHYPEVHTLHISGRDGFDPNPAFVRSGDGNSGAMAIHTAVHLGGTKIVLLGYDMQPTNGRNHHHDDHPEQRPINFRVWVNAMTTLAVALQARGVTVLNASRETALQCFPRVSLKEALS